MRECVDTVQGRVLLGVLVVSMRVKLTKVLHRIQMALPARVEPILARCERAIGIVETENVMSTVAIRALRGRCVSQFSQFAVRTHGVTTGQIGMAVSTIIGDLGAEVT